MKTKFQKKRKQIVTNMNITIVVSNKKRICKQKKQIAKTKSKFQKQNQIAKRETFANERERERERERKSIWKQKFTNIGWAKIFL